jgi:DinB superfamily
MLEYGECVPDLTIRPAYSKWPDYNRSLRDIVAAMTAEQLAIQPSPERWPLWATVGHAACQRVFWLCDFAGEPGAETTRFTDAGHDCPGDDDLEHVLSAGELVEALDTTFRIVEGCLDRWTLDMLAEEIRREAWGPDWVHTRGAVIQRVFAHDIYHAAELNEALGIAGLAQVDFWD